MANCPGCSEPLTGFVTRETLKTQLEAKDAANKLTSAALAKAQTELEGVADIRAQHEAATAKIAKMERTSLLASKGITDPAVIETMEVLHAAKVAGAEEPVAFEDFEAWGATENPLLASLFAPPPEGEEVKQPPSVRAAQGPDERPHSNESAPEAGQANADTGSRVPEQ